MIGRLPNWRSQLESYIDGVRRTPMRPGQHDCALFAAGAVAAMTGHDYAAEFRGQYSTFNQGLKIMRDLGHDDAVGLVASIFEEQPIAMATVGDIAAVGTEAGPALGIVGGGIIFLAGLRGLTFVDLIDGPIDPDRPNRRSFKI